MKSARLTSPILHAYCVRSQLPFCISQMDRLCFTDDTPQHEKYFYVRSTLRNISLDALHSQGACDLNGLQVILDNVPPDDWSETLQPAVVEVCSPAALHPTPTCLPFFADSRCARLQFIVEKKAYFTEYMGAASNPLTWERTALHAKRWVESLKAKPVQPTLKGKPTSTGKAKASKPKFGRKEIAGRPASKATAKKETTSIVHLQMASLCPPGSSTGESVEIMNGQNVFYATAVEEPPKP